MLHPSCKPRRLRGLRKPMRGTRRCTVDFGIHHAQVAHAVVGVFIEMNYYRCRHRYGPYVILRLRRRVQDPSPMQNLKNKLDESPRRNPGRPSWTLFAKNCCCMQWDCGAMRGTDRMAKRAFFVAAVEVALVLAERR